MLTKEQKIENLKKALDSELTPEHIKEQMRLFLTQLEKLFSENKLTQMSLAAKKFAKPEAAKIIAEELIKLGNK